MVPHLAEHTAEFPHVAEGDFSANDLRQLRFATELFDRALGALKCPAWCRKLFMDMREFSVKSLAHGHRAHLANQLPTGTTTTTARNSVWNSTIETVYAEHTKNRGRGLILGDDYLRILRDEIDVTHWQQWVRHHTGMVLTGATPRLAGEATFLSRRLHIDTDTPCMMPKLGKALARFNVRTSKNQSITDQQYMAGKALSYAYEFRHFPVFRDLFLMRYRAEGGHVNVSPSEMSWYTRVSGVDVSHLEAAVINERVVISEDETREFLMDCYGDLFGLVDALDISRRIILCTDIDIVVAPHELAIDW
jgi:hypothetical protein